MGTSASAAERARRNGRDGVGLVFVLLAEQDVDDVSVLVDRPVQVPPPSGHLHVGLVTILRIRPALSRSAAQDRTASTLPSGQPLRSYTRKGHVDRSRGDQS